MRLSQKVQEKVLDIGGLVLCDGSLDARTKAVIAVAAALASNCPHCHVQFAAMARKFGATEPEIEEAQAIALRMKQPCGKERGLSSLAN